MWNSIDKLSVLVSWLDYAGAIDIIAAIVLLITWLRNKESSDRGLAFWGILLSFVAGGLWVFDAKAAHQLARIQQKDSDRHATIQDKSLQDVTSQLARVTSQYDQSTNALAEANARLSAIKPPKQRLIEVLNSVDAKMLVGLRSGTNVYGGRIDLSKFDRLEEFANDPETSRFISITKTSRFSIGTRDGVPFTGCFITLDRAILDP
jgi:hypothetical protein